VFYRADDSPPIPFQRGSTKGTSTSPARAHGKRSAAGPLTAAGRPVSLLLKVEALLAKQRRA